MSFLFFIPKLWKCIKIFCLGLIFHFSNIYWVLLHNLSNALNISISTRLLSSIQKLLPYNTLCFALAKLDTYLLLYFLPALYIFERKGALHTPPPKKKKINKKNGVYIVKQHFFKYIVENLNFFWNFSGFTYQNIRLRFYVYSLLLN